MIEQSEKYHDDVMVSILIFSACKLLSQNINVSYLCYDELLEIPSSLTPVIDTVGIMRAIIAECSKILIPIERELQLVVNCKKTPVRINEKVFTLAVMNLLQNALLYSPPKSSVVIEVYESCYNICIEITNLIEFNSNSDNDENSGLGIPLCNKIAARYNGNLEYVEIDGKTITKLALPIANDSISEEIQFSSEIIEYISERFKPTRLFMHEVVNKINHK